MNLKLHHVLQSPESTQTTSSGSNAPPSDGGAPAGAPDVADKVTDKQVVDENTDWDSLGSPDDETPPGDETPPSTGEEPAAPAPSGQQPKPGEKPQAPPSEQPGDQPPKPGDEPAQPAPQQPPQETPEQIEARKKAAAEAETKAFEDLKKFYEIPAEMAERLRTEPELVMPEMAAKVHQAVFRGMQQYMAQVVPQFLAQQARVQEANTKTKEAFFARWPSLSKHETQVLQIAGMFHQMNPKATPQERLEQVGKLACTALGITPDPAPSGGNPPPPPRKGTPPAKPGQPFKPGNPAGSSAAATPPSDNVFTQMAEEFLEDESGQ